MLIAIHCFRLVCLHLQTSELHLLLCLPLCVMVKHNPLTISEMLAHTYKMISYMHIDLLAV